MVAIVVTRAGRGEVLSFKTVLLADNHPMTQYGDPIMTEASHLRSCLTMRECSEVARKIGEESLARDILATPKDARHVVGGLMDRLWKSLCERAPQPPADPAEVFRRIVTDRVATRHTGVHLRPRGEFEMNEEAVNEANAGNETAAADASAEQAKKPRPIPKDPKYPDTAKISLLKDKDGKQYGADHNPKKVASASHERFAKYVDGMTVAEAKTAGLLNGDFDNDVKKGYISIA